MKTVCRLLQLFVIGTVLFPKAVPLISAAEPPRPNILVFYVDDMGWGSIGPNGQAERRNRNLPNVRTPNLDRLAADGVNFTRGYGCHVCSPARSSLQTGFHQGHTFADRNDPDNAKKAIRADDPSIGKLLSSVGYVTGYWGKWGYGGSKDLVEPVLQNIQTLPTSHGYRFVLAELHHVRAHTFFQPTLWSAPATSEVAGGVELIPNSLAPYLGNAMYPDSPAWQNDPAYPATAYCDDAYAFAALDFVRAQGEHYNASGQPFMGLLGVQIPHAPFDEVTALPHWDRAYADDPHFATLADQSRRWAAMVTRIDAHFGNILAALEDPNNDGNTSDSIADDTLVVFQSDNGGPRGKNNVEFNANGGLSGTKGKIQEGGIRVPFVMRWPAMIHNESLLQAGSNCQMVIDVTDLLPTFCELAGAPIPLGIDGVSIAPTLLGRGHQRHRDFIIHEASNGQSIIRDQYKLIRSGKDSLELYKLSSDPTESRDIAISHPELVEELAALLLGERVTESKGFANTYHHWTGENGGLTSEPDNWSDYSYMNDGITYMHDDGAPQLSWIATIENTGQAARVARAENDLRLLGLEVRGNSEKKVEQSLLLGPNINLEGRNEIRLSDHARLSLNGGVISSLRWFDIYPGGTLQGFGSIEGAVYNQGRIAVGIGDSARLRISGDFHQAADALLSVIIRQTGGSSLDVAGKAELGGQLLVETPEGFRLMAGDTCPVLVADRIEGEFNNPNNQAVTSNGQLCDIQYSETRVILIAR